MGGNYSFPGFGLIGATPVLRVNRHGRRYSDEAFGTHILAALPGAYQPNGNLWAVFDDQIERQITFQTPCHGLLDYTDAQEYGRFRDALEKARGQKNKVILDRDRAGESRPLYCADTLEQLAALMFADEGDRSNFLQTVERYNQLCHQGHDDDFGKDARLMQTGGDTAFLRQRYGERQPQPRRTVAEDSCDGQRVGDRCASAGAEPGS